MFRIDFGIETVQYGRRGLEMRMENMSKNLGLKTVTLIGLLMVTYSLSGGAEGTKTAVKSAPGQIKAGIDRLEWVADLEKKLKNGPRPSCIGPLGCKADIPKGSPCRAPVKKAPEVKVDGIVPGSAPDTWVIAYRLTCSACYEGGDAYLVLLHIGKGGQMQFLDKIALKKKKGEIPKPLEMVQDDFDENGKMEVACQFSYIKERPAKCTGMADASRYLIVVRPDKNRLRELYHAQLTGGSDQRRKGVLTSYSFDDVSEDGYPDLVTTEVRGPGKKGAGMMTRQQVYRFDEESDSWEQKPFVGILPFENPEITCDMPLPDKPFAVVAAMHKEKKVVPNMGELLNRLIAAGFENACLYEAEALKGIKAAKYVTIVSAHETRKDADDVKIALRRAGFSPFVKQLFK